MKFSHRLRHPALLACLAAASASFAQAPRYTVTTVVYSGDVASNAVLDTRTGLTWRRCAEGQVWNGTTCTGSALTFTHEAALTRAAAQTPAWRLPNVKELSSIADKALQNPAIDSTAFPAAPSNYFWSASPYVGNPSGAWVVSFGDGGVYGNGRSTSHLVRLVR